MGLLLCNYISYCKMSELCSTQGDMRSFNQGIRRKILWEMENDVKIDHSETEYKI